MLDNAYTFLPFFYFGVRKKGGSCLVISDRPERAAIDYSLLHLDLTFAFVGKSAQENIVSDYRVVQPASLNSQKLIYELILLDVTREQYETYLPMVSPLLKPGGVMIILDWQAKNTAALKHATTHWRTGDVRQLMQKTDAIRQLELLPEWYLLIEPNLKKPRYFVAPGFRTSIPAGSESAVKRWLVRRGVFYLQPHPRLLVLSKTGEGASWQPAFIDQVIAAVLKQSPSVVLRQNIRQFYISTTNILILRITGTPRDFFLRFPFTEAALQRLKNQDLILRELQKKGIDFVPQPSENIETHIPFFAETAVDGRNFEKEFSQKNLAEAEQYYSLAQEKIRQVHLVFGKTVIYDEQVHTRFQQPRLQSITAILPMHAESIASIGQALFAYLQGKRVLLTLCHGDFKIGNCLFKDTQQISGIIDWDMAEHEAPALLDIAGLWGKSMRHRHKLGLAELVLSAQQLPHDFWQIYQHYFTETETDEISRYPAMVYYWMDRVYKQITFDTNLDDSWIDKNILPVLSHFSTYSTEQIKSMLFNS